METNERPAQGGPLTVAITTANVSHRGDIPRQPANWYPPHRGRASHLVIVPLCLFCLGGHRHVVENTKAKTVTKACPVTGTAYTLDVPRTVRHG